MIYWDVNPEIFKLGPFTIRWYGVLFAMGFLVGYQIMSYIFKKENKNLVHLNDLLWYMILGTVIGARLGHCLFYNPDYYLNHPLEIIMVWKGGLASHGGAIGILLALYYFVKKYNLYSYLWLLDRIAIPAALGGSFIRLGNLFNSEIIGKPTNSSWGFIFAAVDNVPRYPAQLFESIAYLLVFIILFMYYLRSNAKFKNGFLLGLFFVLVFSFRFFVEFIKEDQTYFEQYLPLNMGQLLSIPFIIAGVYLLIRKERKTIVIK
ncbi:prolipoprotein diacylglyceryl transferase [Rosettibacter firmus]|uniref:prolipoprotein diacylglyceryl transferase n=1 Tax=Rosettibacter firmus TaxID=3111522 RepID=UPI00336BDEE7